MGLSFFYKLKLIVSTDKKTYKVCESVECKTLKKRNCFCFPLQSIVLILLGTFTGSKWSSALMVEVTSSHSFISIKPVCDQVLEFSHSSSSVLECTGALQSLPFADYWG